MIRDNGDGTFSFHAGGNYSDGSRYFACICTNENTQPVRNWTWSDHGSKMYIIENPNIDVDDIIVGISDVPAGQEPARVDAIYNLSGQRLSAMPKSGVVIVNRKKVIVRLGLSHTFDMMSPKGSIDLWGTSCLYVTVTCCNESQLPLPTSHCYP